MPSTIKGETEELLSEEQAGITRKLRRMVGGSIGGHTCMYNGFDSAGGEIGSSLQSPSKTSCKRPCRTLSAQQ